MLSPAQEIQLHSSYASHQHAPGCRSPSPLQSAFSANVNQDTSRSPLLPVTLKAVPVQHPTRPTIPVELPVQPLSSNDERHISQHIPYDNIQSPYLSTTHIYAPAVPSPLNPRRGHRKSIHHRSKPKASNPPLLKSVLQRTASRYHLPIHYPTTTRKSPSLLPPDGQAPQASSSASETTSLSHLPLKLQDAILCSSLRHLFKLFNTPYPVPITPAVTHGQVPSNQDGGPRSEVEVAMEVDVDVGDTRIAILDTAMSDAAEEDEEDELEGTTPAHSRSPTPAYRKRVISATKPPATARRTKKGSTVLTSEHLRSPLLPYGAGPVRKDAPQTSTERAPSPRASAPRALRGKKVCKTRDHESPQRVAQPSSSAPDHKTAADSVVEDWMAQLKTFRAKAIVARTQTPSPSARRELHEAFAAAAAAVEHMRASVDRIALPVICRTGLYGFLIEYGDQAVDERWDAEAKSVLEQIHGVAAVVRERVRNMKGKTVQRA